MKKTSALFATILLVSALSAVAGPTLSIRLVAATKQAAGGTRGLSDVAPVLEQNLPFSGFRHVASTTMSLPATGQTKKLNSYTVTCSGPQHDLAIVVRRGRKRLLSTKVSLQANKPLIVGGFPVEGGKMMLIFLAKP